MDNQNHDEAMTGTQPVESARAKGSLVINPVDETLMEKLLLENPVNSRGLVLRLAWLQGLSRDEICNLTWSSIDMENKQISVNGREIPMHEETEQCLTARQGYRSLSPYVVISETRLKPYAPPALSNMVRTTLNKEGMKRVRLIDLRHDFVIRQAKEYGRVHAAKVAGLTAHTFQAVYAKLGIHKQVEEIKGKNPDYNAEFNMWQVMQENKESAEGIALWLRWELDLQLVELVELTWDDIDFATNEIRLSTRTVTMPSFIRTVLFDEKQRRSETGDPHVLLSPRSRTPIDTARLSRLIHSLLIRNGITEFPVRYLRGLARHRADKDKILKLARSQRGIVMHDVLAVLDIPQPEARRRLKELVEGGKLIQIRSTYYLPEITVPPERHEEEVIRYLNEWNIGSLDDLADHLGLQKRQCSRILDDLVKQGKLCKKTKGYILPSNG